MVHNLLFCFSVRFVRRVISGLFGLSTFVLIYWIAVIRWADLVDMTSYVLYIFIGAYSCLVCCILNTFDLKKHIIQVTKTATLNVHVRPDPSDKTRKVVIVDEKSKAKRPPNRDRPPRSHDVTPIRPSTFSVNQETVKFLLPPSKDQVSHHANTDDGQTSKKVLKSALRKSKMYDESVHRCTTRL